MSIQQSKTMPLNSAAGPLPTGGTGTRLPLTAGSCRCIQEADLKHIFDADPAILGCANTVFRCRQRNCGALRRSTSNRQILGGEKSWSGEIAKRRLAMAGTVMRIVMARRPALSLPLAAWRRGLPVALAQKMLDKF